MSKFTIMSEFLLLSAAIFCCLSFSSLPVLGFAPTPSPTQDLSHLIIALRAAARAAIEKATLTFSDIKLVLQKPSSNHERSAMSHCLDSYDDVIISLKKTLHPEHEPGYPDDYSPGSINVWLGAASTSISDCKDGISLFNLTRPAFIDRYDPSDLIDYGLHITVEMMKIIGEWEPMPPEI